MCKKQGNAEVTKKKVWIVSNIDSDYSRVQLCAFGKREDAVAVMEKIQKGYQKSMRHTYVELEEVDDLLVLVFYGEDDELRIENAVMTELNVA